MGFCLVFDGADDGKVSVAATKVEGMRDHIILPVTHTFIMNAPNVLAQTLDYLETGQLFADLTSLSRRCVLPILKAKRRPHK